MPEQSLFSPEEFKKLKPAKGGKRQKREEKVQLQVCSYLKAKYPHVIFQCDLASGMNLGKRVGGMNTRLRSSRGMPDLFIAQPIYNTVCYENKDTGAKSWRQDGITYAGLFIELKMEGARLKNGNISSSDHHREQQAVLDRLRAQGFKAEFAAGYEEAIKLIDDYLQ
jgi:hypothetical protein